MKKFANKYLKYDEFITEEIFNKIVKVLKADGIPAHTKNNKFLKFIQYGYLKTDSTDWWITGNSGGYCKIKMTVKDILGESKDESWCVKVTEDNIEAVRKWHGYKGIKVNHVCGITTNMIKGHNPTQDNYFDKLISTEEFYKKIGHTPKSELKWEKGAYVEYLGTKEDGDNWDQYFGKFGVVKGDVGIISTINYNRIFITDTIRSSSDGGLTKKDLKLITKEEYQKKLRSITSTTESSSKSVQLKAGDWGYVLESYSTNDAKVGYVGKLIRNQRSCGGGEVITLKMPKGSFAAKIRKATNEEIKIHLLSIANKDYPKGTKYINNVGVKTEVKGKFKCTISIDTHVTDGYGGAVYEHDKWAEIISKPDPIIKPVKGIGMMEQIKPENMFSVTLADSYYTWGSDPIEESNSLIIEEEIIPIKVNKKKKRRRTLRISII